MGEGVILSADSPPWRASQEPACEASQVSGQILLLPNQVLYNNSADLLLSSEDFPHCGTPVECK